MKSSLAYIDETMEREVDRRSTGIAVPKASRDSARAAATKVIAGFSVFDEEDEKRRLDAMIAKQREKIEAFIGARKAIRDKLNGMGISPLAILPTLAWDSLCRKAGLFRFKPDSGGRVNIHPAAFEKLPAVQVVASAWTGKTGKGLSPDDWAKGHWVEMLERMFPGGVEPEVSRDHGAYYYTVGERASTKATLILPTPPADVVAILVKGQSLALRVAAAPEAISFKESIASLQKGIADAQRAEDKRLEDDPIVYTEHEGATAIIAQFGDFPIEQELVDLVAKGDDLIPNRLSPATTALYSTTEEEYRRQLFWMMAAQSQASSFANRSGSVFNLLGS